MNRSTDDIQFETDGELGLITLDRPRALNALTLAMVDNLSDTLNDWRSRADVRRVLIKATPGRAFCAGG
ncbi:MAG: enoyl-CoA hydratase/isomerase family protein, partial [Pseudomonadota bacterium]